MGALNSSTGHPNSVHTMHGKEHTMMRSTPLRLLLCLFLLPLALVLSMPGAANAAGSDTLSFHLDAGFAGNASGYGSADCTIAFSIGATTDGNVLLVGAGSKCEAGPDFTPGYCMGFESACSSYTVDVVQDSYVCDSFPLTDFEGPRDGIALVQTVFAATQTGIDSCQPTEICLIADPAGPATSDCTATVLGDAVGGPVGPVEKDCGAVYAIMEPQIGEPQMSPPTGSPGTIVQGFRELKAQIASTTAADPSVWTVYVYYEDKPQGVQGDASTERITNTTLRYRLLSSGTTQPGTAAMIDGTVQVQNPWYIETYPDSLEEHDLVGYGVYRTEPGDNPGGFAQIPAINGSTQFARGGVTDDTLCSFYWGRKIALFDAPGDDRDEPVGPATEGTPIGDPAPTPDPITDPQPEEDDALGFGWLGELLKLLIDAVKAVGTAIGNLVSALVNGFKNMLSDLFVPSEGYLDNRVDRLSTAWDDTTPVKWADELSDLSAGQASGCSGMPLNVTLPGGVQVNESLGAACTGSMATIAGLVRVVLGSVIVVSGLMACVRAVGSGFGWNPGVGKVTT